MENEEKQKTDANQEATGQKTEPNGEKKGGTGEGQGTEGKTEKRTEQGTERKGIPGSETAKIAELQGMLIGKTDELSKAAERVADMERMVAEANDKVGKLDGSLKQAVSSYKTLITKANPDVLPEMLAGESISELDASLGKARELIGKIKTGLETQSKATKVPAGAPQRGSGDTSALSSREKIRVGMERAGR